MPSHLLRTLFTLSFGFTAWILATQHAAAQAQGPQCGPRAEVLQALGNTYGEARRAIGIAGQNNVMEMFSNPDTGTWTVTATNPNGLTCLIASGSSFEAVDEPAPAKGAPT